jgi:hypothetical protein
MPSHDRGTGHSGTRGGMGGKNHVARDISYAYPPRPSGGRALIRAVENATGRSG